MGNARKDRLCAKHADELKSGRIIVNEEGLFVEPKTGKILNKNYQENKVEKEVVAEQNGVAKCIASLGKQNGMLLGIKAEKIEILEEPTNQKKEAIVGIYNKSLTKRGEYDALMGIELY